MDLENQCEMMKRTVKKGMGLVGFEEDRNILSAGKIGMQGIVRIRTSEDFEKLQYHEQHERKDLMCYWWCCSQYDEQGERLSCCVHMEGR